MRSSATLKRVVLLGVCVVASVAAIAVGYEASVATPLLSTRRRALSPGTAAALTSRSWSSSTRETPVAMVLADTEGTKLTPEATVSTKNRSTITPLGGEANQVHVSTRKPTPQASQSTEYVPSITLKPSVAANHSIRSLTPSLTRATKPSSAPAEVTVHVSERYRPFESRITVGVYSASAEQDDYRLVSSFRAFAATNGNRASMICWEVVNAREWVPLRELPYKPKDAFCVQQTERDDATTFAIAQFERDGQPNHLVTINKLAKVAAIQEGIRRGWAEKSFFRVPKVQIWQVAPALTLVFDIAVIEVEKLSDAKDHCQPDPLGLYEKKIEGGNYDKDVSRTSAKMLCVSYAKRSLQDIPGDLAKDMFYADVGLYKFVSGSRSAGCGKGMDAVLNTMLKRVTFNAAFGRDRVLCYTRLALATSTKGGGLTPTSRFLQRIHIDDAAPRQGERIAILNHKAHAWDFPRKTLNLNTVGQF